MAILILGASGRTGALVLEQALKRNHDVVALVRSPTSLEKITLPAEQQAKLTTVTGSPLNAEDVASAVAAASSKPGPLVVISALNSRRTSENPWAPPHPTDSPPRMMADSVANVLTALAKLPPSDGPKPKVVHVSAVGVGSSIANAGWLLRTFVNRSNVKLTYDDHEAVEQELEKGATTATWVAIRPARLTDDEVDDGAEYKVWPAEKGAIGFMAKCSRGAVARFALDAAEGTEYDNRGPVLLT